MNGREVILLNESHGHAVVAKTFWPWCKTQLHEGRQVVIGARLAEDVKTDKQRRYLHGYVLKTIAAQAQPNGQKFDMAVWKEHFRSEFLGFKVVTTVNPMTRKKLRRRVRVSTEDLGVKGYAEYIERVTAYAVTELGVEFVEQWIDPETGEIHNLTDMRTYRRAARKPRAPLEYVEEVTA
jgi:hypothetical protein